LQEWDPLEPHLGSAEIQISEELCIVLTRQEERAGSMLDTNHTCDPNIAIPGQIVFVALREIAPDEELTHDRVTTNDLDYGLECRYESASRRGTVTGKD